MSIEDTLHDSAEERENDTRRDDSLEREFGTHAEEFYHERHREREITRQRNDILFSEYLADRRKGREREDENVGERADNRTSARIQRDEIVALQFRDAQMHSTAVASLEGETASVGDEQQENVPDEEHPDSTAQK